VSKISAVVGLDISLTETGIVRFPRNAPWTQQVIDTKPKDGQLWERYEKIMKRVLGVVGKNDLVFCEDYAYSIGAGKSRLVTLGELGGMLRFVLWKRTGHWPFAISPTSLKKFATGHGRGKKSDIRVALFKKTQLDFANDNIADAYVLAQIGLNLIGLLPIPHRETWLKYEMEVRNSVVKSLDRNGRWQELLQALALDKKDNL
jgi:crossover junction endodeoxyribonuclease RuvC